MCFAMLWKQYNECEKLITSKIPKTISITEQLCQVFGNMVHTSGVEDNDLFNPEVIEEFVTNAAWDVCSTYHLALKIMLCTMYINIPRDRFFTYLILSYEWRLDVMDKSRYVMISKMNMSHLKTITTSFYTRLKQSTKRLMQ